MEYLHLWQNTIQFVQYLLLPTSSIWRSIKWMLQLCSWMVALKKKFTCNNQMVLLIRIILNGLQVAKKPVWIEASSTMLEQNNQEFFKNSGYVQNDAEPCIYYKHVEESFVIATVYCQWFADSFKWHRAALEKKKLSERLTWWIKAKFTIALACQPYLTSILKRFGMSDCKPGAW